MSGRLPVGPLLLFKCIINSVLQAFYLVLSCYLLKDRHKDDDSTRFTFDSCMISLSQSECVDSLSNQLIWFILYRQWITSNGYFHEFAKMGKGSNLFSIIKTNKILYYLFLYYIKQIDSMLPCLFGDRSQKTSKCGKNISDTLGYCLKCHFLVLTTFWHHLWSSTDQMHGNMECIIFFNQTTIKEKYWFNSIVPESLQALACWPKSPRTLYTRLGLHWLFQLHRYKWIP